jgi:hypothetical protein
MGATLQGRHHLHLPATKGFPKLRGIIGADDHTHKDTGSKPISDNELEQRRQADQEKQQQQVNSAQDKLKVLDINWPFGTPQPPPTSQATKKNPDRSRSVGVFVFNYDE